MQIRWYQQEAHDATFNYFVERGKDAGNPVIAMPTGTGKSLVLAMLVCSVMNYPNQRVAMLVHVKELIEQNAAALRQLWPQAPLGIYSDGLGRKDIGYPITFAGIGSVNSNPEKFGRIDVLFIDEAHLVSPKQATMYQKVIAAWKLQNPFLKVVGLTATPYRLGQGLITDDGLFTDICYDITGVDAFNRLIAEGFLAPVIPKKTNTEIDLTGVNIVGGDYVQKHLQIAADKAEITHEALKEVVFWGKDRWSWLIFASGVEHAKHISEALRVNFGIPTTCVHNEMSGAIRDERVRAFKLGHYRAIVGNNIFTTGFDHPPVDLIAMLRPTASPGLWVQMLGRGTRPYDWQNPQQYRQNFNFKKKNCLVLDFAGNTRRLGPINDPRVPRKKGNGPAGELPVKLCPSCGAYNHLAARECAYCGHAFPIQTKIKEVADHSTLIKDEPPIIETWEVESVFYSKHVNKRDHTKPPTLKVTYHCRGFEMVNEFICFEHSGNIRNKALNWWRQRHKLEAPDNVDQALSVAWELRQPKQLAVWVNKPGTQFKEIHGYVFE